MTETPIAPVCRPRPLPCPTMRPREHLGMSIPAWRQLAAEARLRSAFAAEDGPLVLFLDLPAIPPALAGGRLRLRFGQVSVMAVPLRAAAAPMEFGPVRLTFAEAQHLAGRPVRLALDMVPEELPPGALEGAPLEAMTLADEAAFFEKVQRPHSRHADARLLCLGARAGYRLPGFAPRAAALTVLGHRVLERDLRRLTAADHAETRWLRAQGRAVVAEGVAHLAGPDTPDATILRWTTSLASVCAMLALCQDEAEEALFFLDAAAGQVDRAYLAPVAAVNLVNACLLQGVLLGLAGRRAEAGAVLQRGLRSFQPCLAAQDLMAHASVLDGMISAARAARLCFVALACFGLLDPRDEPRIDPGTRIELGQLASPIARILAAGLCPGIAKGLAGLEATAC